MQEMCFVEDYTDVDETAGFVLKSRSVSLLSSTHNP